MLHTHVYYQIYYIAKGSLTHYVGEESSRLSAGDMFIIPPGVVHRIKEDEGIVFYSLSFMPEVVDEMRHTASFAADFLRSLDGEARIRPKITIPSDEVLRIESIIDAIYREFEEKQLAGFEIIKLNLALLLSLFARICYDTAPALPLPEYADRKYLIMRCVEYVEQNFYRQIALEDMVRLSTMSKSEFCRAFREVAGSPFHQYLNQCRIRKACECIKRGDRITAIYTFCGYEDFSTFYRNFVKVVGVSPARYRKLQSDRE